jgi:hypothetical protein
MVWQKDRNNGMRLAIFAALFALSLLAIGMLITLDLILFRFYADIITLFRMFEFASLRDTVSRCLWLVELLLSGVLTIATLGWGYQTTLQFMNPRQPPRRSGDDPAMRYLLATVVAIAFVEILKRQVTAH